MGAVAHRLGEGSARASGATRADTRRRVSYCLLSTKDRTDHTPERPRDRPGKLLVEVFLAGAGVVIVAVQWLLWFGLAVVVPEALMVAFAGGAIGGLAVVLWWVFLSSARWSERLGVIAVMAVAVIATWPLLDHSIQVAVGGVFFYIYVIPGLCLAVVAGAAVARRLSTGRRMALIAAAILIACGGWTLVRAEGFSVGRVQLAWRWTPTAEERLLAHAVEIPTARPAPAASTPAPIPPSTGTDKASSAVTTTTVPAMGEPTLTRVEWPGFRGPATASRWPRSG